MVISVIVPTHRRPDSLRECLAGLSRQDFERAFEVVVVNDGGENLEDLVASFRGRLEISLENQPQSGPARARNRGALLAATHRLAFLDDDCVPNPGWLRKLWEASERFPAAMVGGRTTNLLSTNPYASASQLLIDYLYDYYGHDGGRSGRFFTSNNLSLPRRQFLELGGFDERFLKAAGEDREFCARWRDEGHSMVLEPAAMVGHAHNLSLRGFWRQHFNYGQAARTYWNLRREASGEGRRFEPPGFYWGLLRYPHRRHGLTSAGLGQTLLFVLAQTANALGYFSVTRLGAQTKNHQEPGQAAQL